MNTQESVIDNDDQDNLKSHHPVSIQKKQLMNNQFKQALTKSSKVEMGDNISFTYKAI